MHSPRSAAICSFYDGEGRVTSVTNQKGLTYALIRDVAGRIVAEEDFDGRRTEYTRDPGRRRRQARRPRDRTGRRRSFVVAIDPRRRSATGARSDRRDDRAHTRRLRPRRHAPRRSQGVSAEDLALTVGTPSIALRLARRLKATPGSRRLGALRRSAATPRDAPGLGPAGLRP